jgi:hypothetical protein
MKNLASKYLLEAIVIFISITGSIMVDNWRTNKEEDKVTKEMLQIMKDELDKKHTKTESYLQFNDRRIIKLQKMVDNFHLRTIPHDSLLLLFSEIEEFEPFDANLTSWESITNSGRINNVTPKLIRYVNSTVLDYRDIAYTISLELTASKILYDEVIATLEPKAYAQRIYFNNNDNNETLVTTNLDAFLNSNHTIEYYSSRLHYAKFIKRVHFKLPLKEEAIIDLIKKELEK